MALRENNKISIVENNNRNGKFSVSYAILEILLESAV